MAVELIILNKNNKLPMLLENALKDTELIKEMELALEKFFGFEQGSLRNSFIRFENFVYKENVDSFILSNNYDHHMKNKHGISIDIDKASKIIDKAKFIISKDYAEFFENAEKNVEEMLQKRLEL